MLAAGVLQREAEVLGESVVAVSAYNNRRFRPEPVLMLWLPRQGLPLVLQRIEYIIVICNTIFSIEIVVGRTHTIHGLVLMPRSTWNREVFVRF